MGAFGQDQQAITAALPALERGISSSSGGSSSSGSSSGRHAAAAAAGGAVGCHWGRLAGK
jgi:hypothetical protein